MSTLAKKIKEFESFETFFAEDRDRLQSMTALPKSCIAKYDETGKSYRPYLTTQMSRDYVSVPRGGDSEMVDTRERRELLVPADLKPILEALHRASRAGVATVEDLRISRLR
jgi:hypothetical protein